MRRKPFLHACILLLFFTASFFAQNQTGKSITAVKTETAPVIDGNLSDDAWTKAVPISDFQQQEPVPGTQPSFKTEVRMLYDDKYLYVSFMCYDPEPEKIIARELKWDGMISFDDNVKIIFDTFDDDRSAYWFGTNPLGAQDDALLTGFEHGGFNEDWNGVWEVSSQILDNGWSAEFRFPFSTFKFYDKNDQVWGVNFQRENRRFNEQDLWSSTGINSSIYHIASAGTLTGINGIKRGNPVYLMPYLTAGAQATEGKDNKYTVEPGLDIKYGVTETLSLDVTFNTDFAQVESDRAQINLSRFPLFFPEKRSFFLEGSKTFYFDLGGNNNLFYSRRIGISNGTEIPNIAGAKLVGKTGDFEIGALSMQTAEAAGEPTTNYSTARLKYDLFGSSYAGVLFTNKLTKNGLNTSIGGDLEFSFNDFLGDKNLIIHAGVAKTEEKDGPENSWAGNFYIDYPNDLIDQYIGYRFIQSNFNPAMGFVSRKGIQQIVYNFYYSPRINTLGIKKLGFSPIESNITYDNNKELATADFTFQPLGIITDAGDELNFEIHRSFDRLDEDFNIFNSSYIYAGKYWFTNYSVELETSPARSMQGEFSYWFGDYYNGNRRTFAVEYSYLVNEHLAVSGDYSYNDIKLGSSNFSTSEVGTRIVYAFNTRVNSSVFAQWNNEEQEININYRFNWKPKIGSDFYLVINQLLSTEGALKGKDFTILAKFVWMFVI